MKLLDVNLEEVKDKVGYQSLVGRLIYLSHTRPDIAFVVSMVSQVMHYRILRYLKGTSGKGILFKKHDHFQVEVYTDVDWVGITIDRRSTSSYCSFVGENLVTWHGKKQNVVVRSSAKAKFSALVHRICEGIWINSP